LSRVVETLADPQRDGKASARRCTSLLLLVEAHVCLCGLLASRTCALVRAIHDLACERTSRHRGADPPAAPRGSSGRRRVTASCGSLPSASPLILASSRRRRHLVGAGLNGQRRSCLRPQRLRGGVVVGSMPGLNVKRRSCRRRTSVSSWRRSCRSMLGLNVKCRSYRRRASASPQQCIRRRSMLGLNVKRQSRHAAPQRLHCSVIVKSVLGLDVQR